MDNQSETNVSGFRIYGEIRTDGSSQLAELFILHNTSVAQLYQYTDLEIARRGLLLLAGKC
jgi:hypothetical protein